MQKSGCCSEAKTWISPFKKMDFTTKNSPFKWINESMEKSLTMTTNLSSFSFQLPSCLQEEILKKLYVDESLKLLKVTKSLRRWTLRNGKLIHQWIQTALYTGAEVLRDEFNDVLRDWVPVGTTHAASEANEEKNRYGGQPCGDAHRVVITHSEAPSEYIHANYVATPKSEKRFICTQGPLESTVADFWYMMLQEESDIIVMLCDFVDNEGSSKCAEYYPIDKDEMKRITPTITVTNIEHQRPINDEMPWVKISSLKLTHMIDGREESRMIRHFRWEGWREGEVPSCYKTPIEVLSKIRHSKKPIVMHCGGGTGRTSILVAIEYLLECVELKRRCPPMRELVKELRSHRLWSILFDLQYLYIYRVIFQHFLNKEKAKNRVFLNMKNQRKYAEFIADYDKISSPPPRQRRPTLMFRLSPPRLMCC